MRKKLSISVFFLILGLVAGIGAATEPESGTLPEVPWGEQPTAAFAESASSGRPIAVDFWAIWCAPCKLMDATTYRDPEVVEAMRGFVPLKVNADANQIFVDRYSIDAFPTLLFLDEDGDEITRLTGMIESPRLLATLPTIRSGYERYRTDVEGDESARSLQSAARYLFEAGNGGGAANLLKRSLKLAKKSEPDSADAIELDLALALLADDRAGSAVKMLEELSQRAANEELRAQSLFSLSRAERARGNEARAEEALTRLRREHPQLAERWAGTE